MSNSFIYNLIFCVALMVSCSNDVQENEVNPGQGTISITGISPEIGPKNTLVTISGSNFGTNPDIVAVFFNGVQAAVQSVEDDTIGALVPEGAYSGTVTLLINGKHIEGPVFMYVVTDEIQSTLLAGSTQGYQEGGWAYSQFNLPAGVALDNAGNLYIADAGNHRIRIITPTGLTSTLAGSDFGSADGQGVNAQFNGPNGVALDSDGNVYVADRYNNRIRKISPGGEVSTWAGSTQGSADGQGEEAQFNEPYDVAVDINGNLYVADAGNNRIRKISPGGTVTTLAGSSPGFADGQGEEAKFNGPYGITSDAAGNLYVADFRNNRIRKITPGGAVRTLAGSSRGFKDGPGADAWFDGPYGVALDMDENVYVADFGNQNIRKVTPEGLVSTLEGSSMDFADDQGKYASLSGPSDVAVDQNGNVFVVDMASHTIHKIPQD